jgi:hypothetical protein
MKPETRTLLESSHRLLQLGLERVLRQMEHFEQDRLRGVPVDEVTWRDFYDQGVKVFHDIAKLAGLEMRDEAAIERKERREAEPVTALAQEVAGAAAKGERHAPDNRPKLHMSALREAWAASSEWLQLATAETIPPLPHKVRKVLPALGLPEGEPLETMSQFREVAAKALGIALRV